MGRCLVKGAYRFCAAEVLVTWPWISVDGRKLEEAGLGLL